MPAGPVSKSEDSVCFILLACLLAEPVIIKSHLLMPLYNFGVHSQDF